MPLGPGGFICPFWIARDSLDRGGSFMKMRTGKVFFAVLFAWGAIVQYNDPDAVRWILIYAAAALLSGIAAWRSMPRIAPAFVAFFALGWALSLMPEIIEVRAFSANETERECFGLLVIAGWMAVLALKRD